MLIQHGANVNAVSQEGVTPIFRALAFEANEVVRVLLQHGVQLNPGSFEVTPLHLAVENGSDSMVEMLLEHGALIDAPDPDGRTPLHVAAEAGHAGIVVLLLEHGAHLSPRNHMGETPRDVGAIHKAVVGALDSVVKVRLRTFMMGTLRNSAPNRSIVRTLPNDILGMIAAKVCSFKRSGVPK
eukprot:c19268_g1_i2.p1 GENE.c19268_g1_i2~~c19268_g1_i2.p1  ORF type:complete len:183 (+),score=30.05 c19268_g1_i2:159-707(+)